MQYFVRLANQTMGPFSSELDPEAVRSVLTEDYPEAVNANYRVVNEGDNRYLEFYTKAGLLG